ncbi:MAG TPA: ATP-binding protein, partial [Blastocatellia bacterium]|nr:ATP-binding protein [Blastocatellia bacterium]
DDITTLFEDSRGDIWIGHFAPGSEVLSRWERATETFHSYSEADGLQPFTSPSSFCEDARGDLWIGFREGGLARYANGRFAIFKEDEGFPPGKGVKLYMDQSGRLWCILSDGRLCRIDDPRAARLNVVEYTKKEGLGKGPFFNLAGDSSGRIYIENTQGIDMLDPATGHVKHYTSSDGLTVGEPTTAFCDRQGKLWFGTNRGLSRFSLQPERDISPPPIFIDDLSIAGVTYRVSPLGEKEISGLEIGPNQNQIQIDFFGMSFGLGEALRYQYKLEGSSVDWSAPTDQRSVNYAILPSGSYRFLVRAVNSIGVTSESPAIIEFRIVPPVWRRWWFLAIVASTVVSAVFAFARYRYQRIRAVREAEDALRRSREERLQELERVRRRIATDLHDDIGSSLTQISIMSEVAQQRIGADDSQLSAPLSMIAGASRELVDSMSDIVWAINPQKDHLRDLTQRMRRFASDVLTARNIAFEFHEPDEESDVEMGANIRREVFLIFKESVNNLVRHSDCSEANIDFQITGESLVLIVRDNGKGFDMSQDSEGHGLASMRQRAAELGGKLEMSSHEGGGTTVTLELPLNRQS